MEVQLQELLDKIQHQGVAEAKKKAGEVEAEAKGKADEIVAAARKQAEGIVSRAKQDAQGFEASAREALRQAGRDLLLRLQEEIKTLFSRVTRNETAASLTPEVIGEILVHMVEAWTKKGDVSAQLLLSKNDLEKVEKYLQAKLSKEILAGVTFTPSASVDAGVRITEKDGKSYVNLTDEGLSEILSAYLNPRIAGLLAGKKDGE
ncbi:MAG: hypothetical protein JW904_08610 [Spirochaetales bacterium]|nr:hypothetical protein [Spirochaetales bacterium]